MKKIINIDGMSCEHCAAHVTEALNKVEGVDSVKVSLFRNNAKVEGSDLKDEDLKKSVEDAGYKVLSIEE
ncbi:MAG: heavy-metal-associated domain-containing protein [Peptoniphilus sp.]|nr:heavy-metal-associated domain-containing protein [Peptoniphilus sp.]